MVRMPRPAYRLLPGVAALGLLLTAGTHAQDAAHATPPRTRAHRYAGNACSRSIAKKPRPKKEAKEGDGRVAHARKSA